jgi:hypothetical protein
MRKKIFIFCLILVFKTFVGESQNPSTSLDNGSCESTFVFYSDSITPVQILSVSGTEILYRYCDDPPGTNYNINKEFVKTIRYGSDSTANFKPGPYVKLPPIEREFDFSVFSGLSFGGTSKQMESHMSSAGFSYLETWGGSFLPGGSQQYPYSKRTPVINFEASAFFTGGCGIAINLGLAEQVRTIGYEPAQTIQVTDPGSYGYTHTVVIRESSGLILRSKIWSNSVNFFVCNKNKTFFFLAGPALVIHKVHSQENNSFKNYKTTQDGNKNALIGAHAGFWFRALQQKRFFLALKTDLTWSPESEIGPFYGNGAGTEYSKAKVQIVVFNVGIALGMRTYKELNRN